MKLPTRPAAIPERHERGDEVGDLEEGARAAPRVEQHRQDDPDEAAVEGHPALPDPQSRQRLAQHAGEVVEEHVADATSPDHAQRDVEEHVVDVRFPPAAGGIRGAHPAQPPSETEGHHVHEAVPVDREGPDLDRDGIEFGISQHRAARSYSQPASKKLRFSSTPSR